MHTEEQDRRLDASEIKAASLSRQLTEAKSSAAAAREADRATAAAAAAASAAAKLAASALAKSEAAAAKAVQDTLHATYHRYLTVMTR
jgi:hypothetical protein